MATSILTQLWQKSLLARMSLFLILFLLLMGIVITILAQLKSAKPEAKTVLGSVSENIKNNPGSTNASSAYIDQLNKASKAREISAPKNGNVAVGTVTAADKVDKAPSSAETPYPPKESTTPYTGPDLNLASAMLKNWQELKKLDTNHTITPSTLWIESKNQGIKETQTNNTNSSRTPQMSDDTWHLTKLPRGVVLPAIPLQNLISTKQQIVTAQVVSGPYQGSLLVGDITPNHDTLTASFTSITPSGSERSYPIKARAELGTSVDKHTFEKYLGLATNVLFGANSYGLSRTGQNVQVSNGTTVISDGGFDTRRAAQYALSQGASALGSALEQIGNQPPTVEMNVEKQGLIGIQILEDFPTGGNSPNTTNQPIPSPPAQNYPTNSQHPIAPPPVAYPNQWQSPFQAGMPQVVIPAQPYLSPITTINR